MLAVCNLVRDFRVTLKSWFQGEAPLTTIQEKLAWLDAVRKRVQQYIEEGGDPRSEEAGPLAMALFQAINDLTNEFSGEPAKPFAGLLRPIKPEIPSPLN